MIIKLVKGRDERRRDAKAQNERGGAITFMVVEQGVDRISHGEVNVTLLSI
jgi:hypothetical protein